ATSDRTGSEGTGPQGSTEDDGPDPTGTADGGSPDTQRDAPISMVQPDQTPRGVASGESPSAVLPPSDDDSLTLGTYRDLWAGPVTELNPPLKFLTPQQRVEISREDAERLSLSTGDAVRVSQNGNAVDATVQVKERISKGVVFMAEGVIDGNANSLLNGGPVQVKIEKLSEPRA